MNTLFQTIALGALVVATTAVAHGKEHDAKARRGYFQLIGLEMGGLAAMAKGQVDYSAEDVRAHLANLAVLTQGYNTSGLFKEGTSNDDLLGETRALPEIWSDNAGFMAKFKDMADAIKAIEGPATTDLDGLRASMGQLGGTCKACHDKYRAKDF
jgi:cytochrome c556